MRGQVVEQEFNRVKGIKVRCIVRANIFWFLRMPIDGESTLHEFYRYTTLLSPSFEGDRGHRVIL